MSPLSNSYEAIFEVIRKLNLPYEDSRQQYLRMVFNVLTRNVDDHSKNFAFCMAPDGAWRLSPAYDLTFSVDLAAPSYVNRHSISINGKIDSITLQDLDEVAKENDIVDHKKLIDKVNAAISNFRKYAEVLDINKKLIGDIERSFVRV